jgi:hypothetical protein
MAFKQYTHCISKADFESFWNVGGKTQDPVIPLFAWGAIQAAKTAFIGALIGAGIGAPFGGAGIGALAGALFGLSLGFVNGFCDQWLNRRLICITANRCAVGKVAWSEPPSGKDFIERLYDNDLSMNVRLIPYSADEFPRDASTKDYDWHQMQTDGFPAAELVKEQFSDLGYQGYEPDAKPNHPGGRWTIHCEFEGDGMKTLCGIAKVLAIFSALATPVLAFVGAIAGALYFGIKNGAKAFKTCRKSCKIPIVCHVVCFVVAVFAAIPAAVVGAVVGALSGPGLAAVIVGGLLGTFVSNDGAFGDAADDPESGNLHDEDCVFVAGDQVYDAGHPEGWLELHPVKHVQLICDHSLPDSATAECCPHARSDELAGSVRRFDDPAFHDQVKRFWDRWCNGYQTSQDPVTVKNQDDPENQWCLHPLIDGCKRRAEPGGPPPIK